MDFILFIFPRTSFIDFLRISSLLSQISNSWLYALRQIWMFEKSRIRYYLCLSSLISQTDVIPDFHICSHDIVWYFDLYLDRRGLDSSNQNLFVPNLFVNVSDYPVKNKNFLHNDIPFLRFPSLQPNFSFPSFHSSFDTVKRTEQPALIFFVLNLARSKAFPWEYSGDTSQSSLTPETGCDQDILNKMSNGDISWFP
jgi:hypothetical protein